MSNLVLSPYSSALADRVRPDPTRPWYVEAGAALSYPTTSIGAGDTVVLNVDRDKIGPFTARTLYWSASTPIQATVSTGGITLTLPQTLTGHITLPRSIDSPSLVFSASNSASFIVLNSLLESQETTASPSAVANGIARPLTGAPVVVIDTPLSEALFMSGLIAVAGATLITPTPGLVRRLQIHIAGNSTLTTAGNNAIRLQTGSTGGSILWAATPYIPATALSVHGQVFEVDLGSGIQYPSLYLNIATAFAAGGVEVAGWG